VTMDAIFIKGAREHNLKNIDVAVPRNKLVVITGVSGSGKSSLAFDTICAEGRRRYMESLSAYARQFLGRMERPDVDYIEGLSPAISVDQRRSLHNPRSTVGTMTEIFDYLRLLFARIGHPHCPECGRPVSRQTVQQITDAVQKLPPGSRIMILSPLVRDRKGEHRVVFQDLQKQGYVRARVDGEIYDLSEEICLDKNRKHTIEAVVDRLQVEKEENDSRLADSIETALKLGSGVVNISVDGREEVLFSEHFACVYCNISLGEITPRSFSFNSPHGACPICSGLGYKLEVDVDMVVPDKNLSLEEGAILPWARNGSMSTWYHSILSSLAEEQGFSLLTPVKDLSPDHLRSILHGYKEKPLPMVYQDHHGRMRQYYADFEGVKANLERRYRETESEAVRADIERYMSSTPCSACQGRRLKPELLAVTIAGKNIMDISAMSVSKIIGWVEKANTKISSRERTIASQIIREIRLRLGFLEDIGLGYLALDRYSATLSGGEAQRIRLSSQIGSGLTGVLYVCDEPTIGLHPADNSHLISTLKQLKDLGNTVIIVEHDEAMMRAADHIIDIGPGAGKKGGEVVATGTLADIMQCPESITGQYLSGEKQIASPARHRPGSGNELIIKGARENNLKNIDVSIPLGKLVCVTGVSGSGKSSLVNEILFKRLAQLFYRAKERPGDFTDIVGTEYIDKVINIDQSPIGRTPRSNPATYTGVFTPIRELFSALPESKMRGYSPGRFSFNVKGGRCEACQGAGSVQIEMQFLPDITVSCEVCKGKRYNREALQVHFKGKNIAEYLDMTVEEAMPCFKNFPGIKGKLQTLMDVGLGYVCLGQPAPTLSGGEAQRVKLAAELSRRSTGRTLYILDEPTTGLSFSDIACLLQVLERLVDAGNTVVIIEHHLDIIKRADHIIDLGPGAGDEGGYLLATGTPEQVAGNEKSLTGRYLQGIL